MNHAWLVAAAAAASIPLLRSAAAPPGGAAALDAAAPAPVHGFAPAPAHDASPASTLLRFEPFIGGRWVADGVLSGGRRYAAERRYEWHMDGRFVRVHQTFTVDSVTVGEEMVIGWDASAGELRFWSFASDGSWAEGRERTAPAGNRWVFEGRTYGGRGGEWRITTLVIDPAAFSVLIELRDDGDFEPAMTLAYRRAADAAPAAADSAVVRPDTAAVQPDTSALQPDTTAVRRDTVAFRPGIGAAGGPAYPTIGVALR